MRCTRFLAVLLVGLLLMSAGCSTTQSVYHPANAATYQTADACVADHPDDAWSCEPVPSSPVETRVVLVGVGSVVLASAWIFVIAVLPFLLMGH